MMSELRVTYIGKTRDKEEDVLAVFFDTRLDGEYFQYISASVTGVDFNSIQDDRPRVVAALAACGVARFVEEIRAGFEPPVHEPKVHTLWVKPAEIRRNLESAPWLPDEDEPYNGIFRV